jgi:hypothetical protein
VKPENFTLSYDKWNPDTGVLSELNKEGRIDWGRVESLLVKVCGHCLEYRGGARTTCKDCTLNDTMMCGTFGNGEYKTLVKMADDYFHIPRNKRKARAIANRIFNQILKDGEGM